MANCTTRFLNCKINWNQSSHLGRYHWQENWNKYNLKAMIGNTDLLLCRLSSKKTGDCTIKSSNLRDSVWMMKTIARIVTQQTVDSKKKERGRPIFWPAMSQSSKLAKKSQAIRRKRTSRTILWKLLSEAHSNFLRSRRHSECRCVFDRAGSASVDIYSLANFICLIQPIPRILPLIDLIQWECWPCSSCFFVVWLAKQLIKTQRKLASRAHCDLTAESNWACFESVVEVLKYLWNSRQRRSRRESINWQANQRIVRRRMKWMNAATGIGLAMSPDRCPRQSQNFLWGISSRISTGFPGHCQDVDFAMRHDRLPLSVAQSECAKWKVPNEKCQTFCIGPILGFLTFRHGQLESFGGANSKYKQAESFSWLWSVSFAVLRWLFSICSGFSPFTQNGFPPCAHWIIATENWIQFSDLGPGYRACRYQWLHRPPIPRKVRRSKLSIKHANVSFNVGLKLWLKSRPLSRPWPWCRIWLQYCSTA